MAAGGDIESLCKELFTMCIQKTSVGQKLSGEDLNMAKSVAVKKLFKECAGLDNTMLNNIDASIFSKYCDKKTKKLDWKSFETNVLPEVCAMKAKVKSPTDPKALEELVKMKQTLAAKCMEWKTADVKGKTSAVVDRLTDTSAYTGAHKARFDADGKGKGLEGREDKFENSGYVGQYKGAGTFDKK